MNNPLGENSKGAIVNSGTLNEGIKIYQVPAKPWLSLMIPSCRPEGLAKFKKSLDSKATAAWRYQYLLGLDEGSEKPHWLSKDDKVIFVPKKSPIPQIFSKLINEADGEWIWFLNDDLEILTDGWDIKLHGLVEQSRDQILLLHPKENLFGEMLCTFPLISKKAALLMQLGDLPYLRYKLDDHIHLLFESLGRRIYVPQVELFHDHLDKEAGPQPFAVPGGFYNLDPKAARHDQWAWMQLGPERENSLRVLQSQLVS